MTKQPNTVAKRTSKPLIAAILMIIAGIGSLTPLVVNPISYLFAEKPDFIIPGEHSFSFNPPFGVIGYVLFFSGLISITAGIFTLKRRYWILSLIGSIASIFGIASLLGIAALIQIAFSKNEFS